jgi:hypothetical protein
MAVEGCHGLGEGCPFDAEYRITYVWGGLMMFQDRPLCGFCAVAVVIERERFGGYVLSRQLVDHHSLKSEQ